MNLLSRYVYLCAFIGLSISYIFADCGDINPRPGENLHGLTTRIGTEVDVVSSRLCVVESKVCVVDSTVDIIESKIDNLCGDVTLTQEDFGALPGGGTYTITVPGHYCLGESVSNATIRINSNDVVLDLNNKILDGRTTEAIVVNGVNDVTIINGTITSTNTGIRVTGSSGTKISNVTIQDIGSVGIWLIEGTESSTVDNCFIVNVTQGAGIEIDNLSQDISILGCEVNNIGGLTGENGFAIKTSGKNTIIESCVASNYGQAGFLLDGDSCLVKVCKAFGKAALQVGTTEDGFFVRGNAENSSGRDTTILLCEAELNGGHGFNITGPATMVKDCVSFRNFGNGFLIDTVNTRPDPDVDATANARAIVLLDGNTTMFNVGYGMYAKNILGQATFTAGVPGDGTWNIGFFSSSPNCRAANFRDIIMINNVAHSNTLGSFFMEVTLCDVGLIPASDLLIATEIFPPIGVINLNNGFLVPSGKASPTTYIGGEVQSAATVVPPVPPVTFPTYLGSFAYGNLDSDFAPVIIV